MLVHGSFHGLHYNYLLQTISFHALLFAHIFFHEQHFFTHNNQSFTHTFILLLFPRKKKDTKSSFHPSFPRPFLQLIFLVQWKLWKSFPLINGRLLLHELMKIDNDLPSNGIQDENSCAQRNTKKVPSSNQIG